MDARHAYHFNQRRGADSVRGNNTSYDILRRRFKQLRPVLESAGLRVFNCNPESKLDAFEKITFDRAAALCLEEWGNINLATERTAGLYDRPKPKPQPPRPTVTLPASFKPGLTVITCTRNRPEAFKLLERWMGRQTRKWDQWLAVNDGQQRYEYTLGQEVIARVPMQGEGHSLTANLLAALPRIRHEHIVFVEDDDWLGPKYLESMSAALKKGPLVGNVPALYYNVATGRWQDMRNRAHASLGQTAIHAKLLPLVAEIAGCGSPQIDLALWRKWSGKKKFIRSGGLHVGIKGMPGENGIGVGHHVDFGKADEKPNLGKLRSWIGEDANVYLRPKISVSVSAPTGQTACIITCHNYGRFLDQCIESCLSQSSPFESIVIVNDASTDDTDVVARRYIRRGVRYLHGHWRDFTLARRAGLEVSPRTPFLLFVDADNWLDRRYHELLRTAMNSSSIGATYGNLLNVNETGRKLGLNPNVGAFDRHVLRLRNFADACSLIRREAYDQVGGWPRNSYLTDWMLWLAMTRYGWTLRHVPEAILNYRLHGAQMSNVRFGNFDLCVEPLRKSCMVAIVTLFCGRQWALERYFRWIAALNWNRENLHVVALDNSASSAFSGKLTQALRDCGLAFSYVADPTHIVSGLSAATFASKREARSHHSYLLAAHMARLYAVARTHMPHGTDFIWTVEDDVEPPSDALHHLLLGLYRYPKAGVVTGCARSRFEDQWILRKGGHPLLSAPAPDTYEPVDATGFYCALFRFPVWDAIAFRPTRDWSLRNCAYDWAAMSDIIQSGWRVLAAGSVRCKHWQADGSFL
ncbi:MAG: glycosyltransferase family A protein [Verrucomicrobia bacterium]|nr:glycosyltransferase family A protein [Verrucomicrobiota bacterium]